MSYLARSYVLIYLRYIETPQQSRATSRLFSFQQSNSLIRYNHYFFYNKTISIFQFLLLGLERVPVDQDQNPEIPRYSHLAMKYQNFTNLSNIIYFSHRLREAAKKVLYLSGPATKPLRGGGEGVCH